MRLPFTVLLLLALPGCEAVGKAIDDALFPDAEAGDPSIVEASRTVVELRPTGTWSEGSYVSGLACYADNGDGTVDYTGCCPPDFVPVGFNAEGEVVCVEL